MARRTESIFWLPVWDNTLTKTEEKLSTGESCLTVPLFFCQVNGGANVYIFYYMRPHLPYQRTRKTTPTFSLRLVNSKTKELSSKLSQNLIV